MIEGKTSRPLKLVWVPITLALTVSLTFFDYEFEFEWLIFLQCLFISTVHFYLAGFLALKYFVVHNPSENDFWRIFSISYVPFILSFWAGFLLHEPSEYNLDLGGLDYIIFGALISCILFAIQCIRKVKMDLDIVLALLF